MSTSLSEVIDYLGFEGTIQPLSDYTTIKVILQEFGSASVTIVTDQNLNLLIEFSNDSLNWDYTNATSIAENTKELVTSVILGKWCHIIVQNVSRQVANVRFSTYCQSVPSTIQSQIEAQGNSFPFFNIANLSTSLFNELRIAERKPYQQINYTYSKANIGVISGPSREFYQNFSPGFIPAISPATIDLNVLTLSNIFTQAPGEWQSVHGPPVIVNSGNPVYLNFSASFQTFGYTDDSFGFDQSLVGMGYVDISSGNIVDGFFVGYAAVPSVGTIVDEIAFVFYSNSTENHVVRSKWIYDRLDGFGASGILLDPTKLSTWRIRTGINNSAFLEYHNVLGNEWVPCHREQFENLYTWTLIRNPSYSFLMYARRTTASVGIFLVPNGVGPQSTESTLGNEVGQKPLSNVETYDIQKFNVPIVAGETEILSIRNGPFINGIVNRSLIIPRNISIFIAGANFILLKMYKNGTFVAPVWVFKDSVHESIETTTLPVAVIGSGYSVISQYLSSGTSTLISLTDCNGNMSRLDTLTFTATSSGADTISITVNYTMVI